MLLKINKHTFSGTTEIMCFVKKSDNAGFICINLIYSDFGSRRDDEFALTCPSFVRTLDNLRVERIPEHFSLRGYVMNNILSKDVTLTTSRGSVSDVLAYIKTSLPSLDTVNRTIVLPNNALMLHTEVKTNESSDQGGNFPV